jgi:indole-3-glycerol phosphate synthase
MTLLDTIVEHKRMEVLKRKGKKPVAALEKMPLFDRTPLDPVPFFKSDRPNIIAEFKRKSPSKGVFNLDLSPENVVGGYRNAGASACSVLTERDFFGGSFRDLESAKMNVPDIPLLRKDFIIDPYQVLEAKAYGADLILLIAAILDSERVKELAGMARTLGMHVLFEVHNRGELDLWVPGIRFVGVNNRDLRTFAVDLSVSERLAGDMPDDVIRISESGLSGAEEVYRLHRLGFQGFLMGERFMRTGDPGSALSELMESLKQYRDGNS